MINWTLVIEGVFALLALLAFGGGGLYLFVQARRKEPQTWKDLQARIGEQDRQYRILMEHYDAQTVRLDYVEAEIDELREARQADAEMIQEWIAYARQLAARFKELTGQEPPPEPTTKRRSTNRRAALVKRIVEGFNTDEIDGLAYDMGMSRDELSGDTRPTRARALVDWAADRGRLTELGKAVDTARPHL